MRIRTHSISAWQSNCYLVTSDDNAQEGVLVDPGIGAAEVIGPELERLACAPVALLLTHGHLDHIGDAHRLAAQFQVPVYCAAADHDMLSQPSAGLGQQAVPLVAQLLGEDRLPLPADLRDWDGTMQLAGLEITPMPAPGHTPGSTLLRIREGSHEVICTGDVLFAGTIGRTDLPGGSMTQMRATLAEIRDGVPADVALLPGHGPATTLAAELSSNSFLQAIPEGRG